jgi:hypothetical protein
LRTIWVDLLDVRIGDVRVVPANGLRDSIVEANKEERTAKPTYTSYVELAGNDQVCLIVLKPIVPWHMRVLDVNNAAIRGSQVRNCPLIRAKSKHVTSLPDFLQRSVNAVEAQIIAALKRLNVFRRDGINP